jgi:hypothetical protein
VQNVPPYLKTNKNEALFTLDSDADLMTYLTDSGPLFPYFFPGLGDFFQTTGQYKAV